MVSHPRLERHRMHAHRAADDERLHFPRELVGLAARNLEALGDVVGGEEW